MKAIRTKSPIDGMYTHKIQADDGRVYGIEKDYKGRLFVNVASGIPVIDRNTVAPFTGRNPDLEHEAIKKLIANAVRAFNRRARHQAMLDLGLTRVKGALGGVYYE